MIKKCETTWSSPDLQKSTTKAQPQSVTKIALGIDTCTMKYTQDPTFIEDINEFKGR